MQIEYHLVQIDMEKVSIEHITLAVEVGGIVESTQHKHMQPQTNFTNSALITCLLTAFFRGIIELQIKYKQKILK